MIPPVPKACASRRLFWAMRSKLHAAGHYHDGIAVFRHAVRRGYHREHFAIPGIGRLATTAIQNRDMPVLQGTVLFTTVLVIAGNLIADLLYSVLDPRIRKEA